MEKCFFSGCKNEATHKLHHLFGERKTELVCESHLPKVEKRSDRMKKAPICYTWEKIDNVQVINLSKTDNILRIVAAAAIKQNGFYTCTINGIKTRIIE